MTEPQIKSPEAVSEFIKEQAKALGMSNCAITDTDLDEHETHLLNWLDNGFHGQMDYMQRHGVNRSQPAALVPGTISIVSVRMDYYPAQAADAWQVLENPTQAYISRYALGRDYHKLMRRRLQTLASRISEKYGDFGYRAFVDSAPVLEKAIAEKAGLGWIGKHSNLLTKNAGSWFFLGELYTDLPLALDTPVLQKYCGSCTACIQACPTNAIVAPYKVDARRCISFNKFSQPTIETDFNVRHALDSSTLAELFSWDEQTFKNKMAGSAIYRIGHERWLRNIAVALGNAPGTEVILTALETRRHDKSELVREHVLWALEQHASS